MKMVFLLFRRFFIYLQTALAHIQKKAYMGEIKLKKGSAYVNNNRKWHALPKAGANNIVVDLEKKCVSWEGCLTKEQAKEIIDNQGFDAVL